MSKEPIVIRPWGGYILLKKTNQYSAKKIFIHKDAQVSFQSHPHREEIWFVLSGVIRVCIGSNPQQMNPGDIVAIPKKIKRQMKGITEAWVLKIALEKMIDEETANDYCLASSESTL